MDIYSIECFLTLAKCLNFTQAAKEQYVSQPTMTSKIHKLEEEFKVKLFNRDKQSVQLTPAGESLYKDFTKMVTDYREAIKQAKLIDTQTDKLLRIGYHGPINWGYIPNVLRDFKSNHPDIHIDINIDTWGSLMSQLINHAIDILFIEKAEVEDHPQLEIQYLYRESVCVAVSNDSTLAYKKSITPKDLMNKEIIMPDTNTAPIAFREINKRLTNAGFNMNEVHYVPNFESALALVSSEEGVSFFPHSFKQQDSNIVYIDLKTEEVYLDMCLAWLKSNDNPSIQPLIKVLKNHQDIE